MQNNFQILYNETDDILEIIKITSSKIIDYKEGKYGIRFYYDISNNMVKIVIPEPNILFGLSISDILSFIKVDL